MRDKELIKKRNEAIQANFAYLYEVKKIRLDETLRILSEEKFFLNQITLWRIISEHKGVLSSEYLAKLKKPKVRIARGIAQSSQLTEVYQPDLFSVELPL